MRVYVRNVNVFHDWFKRQVKLHRFGVIRQGPRRGWYMRYGDSVVYLTVLAWR